MNHDPAPLEPSELDELLSADLDGELAAAARERGSDVEAVRARIAATPDAAERRAALSAARAMLASEPELNELDAARLRQYALQAAEAAGSAREARQRTRRNRVLLTVSGVAACIIVVVGIAFAAGRSSSSSDSSRVASLSPRSVQPKADLTSPVPALGAYNDAKSLGSAALNTAQQRAAAQVQGQAGASGAAPDQPPRALPTATATSLAPAVQSASGAARDSNSHDTTFGSTGSADGLSGSPLKNAVKATACPAAKFAGPGEVLMMHASATLDGRPVGVYVFAGNGGHTVVVLGQNCALVTVQFAG